MSLAALLCVSVAAALGAAALRSTLEWATAALLGSVVRLRSEGGGLWALPDGPLHGRLVWLLPAVIAAAMAAAAALSRIGRHGIGGTDGVIGAINDRDLSGLDVRGAALKLAGTVLTLGSGGSGGTEGPVAQVSASLGASIVRRLRLSEGESGLAVAAALGAGVGALFQAPVAGALLAGEVLRRRGFDWMAVLFAIPAAPLAFVLFIGIYGYQPMFGRAQLGPLWDPGAIGALAVTGVVCGLAARLYVWSFHTAGRLFRRPKRWPEVTAAVTGAVVGTIGIFLPMTLGTGYATVSSALSDTAVAAWPLWLLAAAPLVKIFSTSITLQSGGVGGVFGPAMVIGATAGALCWRLAVYLGLHAGPAALFTAAGVAACLGPAVRSPCAALVLALEATGHLLPPIGIVVAVGVAVVCAGRATVFPSQAASQLPRRYRQLDVSDMLKAVTTRTRIGVSRMLAARRPEGRKRSDASREGCAMRPETRHGLLDLADLPLEALLSMPESEVRHAFRIARHRRDAVGITFAGHNVGGA